MNRAIFRGVFSRIEEVEAAVFEVVKGFRKVRPEKVRKETAFSELGLDSLDVVEVVLDLEDKLRVRLQEAEVLKIRTVMDAVSIFHKYK
jgi:acyl carrier protein